MGIPRNRQIPVVEPETDRDDEMEIIRAYETDNDSMDSLVGRMFHGVQGG